jgi:hypothetical protein
VARFLEFAQKIKNSTRPRIPIRARLSQHPAFQRMIYQKQGRRLRGMIDRSHQPTSEVALCNKLKALGYWIR